MGAIPFSLIRHSCDDISIFMGAEFEKRSFSSISLPELHGTLSADCLYLVDSTLAARYCMDYPHCWFLAVSPEDVAPTHRNLAIATFSEDRLKLLFRMNKECDPYFLWVSRLDEMILQGCTFQSLFDASSNFLRYWIALVDDSFRLVAYSHSVSIDEPTCLELIKNGRHSHEAMRRLQPFHGADNDDGPLLFRAGRLRYETAVRRVEVQGRDCGHIVAVNCHKESNPCWLDCANVFADRIVYRCALRFATSGGEGHRRPADSLLDMLSRRETANENMPYCIHFAHDLGFAKEAGYLFGFIRLKDPSMQNLLEAYRYITDLPIRCLASIKGDQVVVMVSVPDDCVRSMLGDIDGYLRQVDGRLFLSSLCDTFTLLPLAFQQAIAVRELHSELSLVRQGHIHGEWHNDGGSRIFYFDDYFLAWFFRADKGDYAFVKYCLKPRFAYKIASASTYDCSLIEVYLRSERSATAAAEMLGMNRSTLIYNVRRIEKEYGVSFDSFETRLEFQMILGYCRAFSPNLINEQP